MMRFFSFQFQDFVFLLVLYRTKNDLFLNVSPSSVNLLQVEMYCKMVNVLGIDRSALLLNIFRCKCIDFKFLMYEIYRCTMYINELVNKISTKF